MQESSPEVLEAKVALLAEIDLLTDPEVVVASSTSGLLMTDMAVECVHPGRLLVGHPFNPPYLIPLVEVVGGPKDRTRRRVLGRGRSTPPPGRSR